MLLREWMCVSPENQPFPGTVRSSMNETVSVRPGFTVTERWSTE